MGSPRISVRVSRIVIPNAITAGSIFAGYFAIVQAFRGEYLSSAWFILAASLLDMLDGRVARWINASSEFGIQFDSLADMGNYGIAPSILFYFLYFQHWGVAGVALGFLPVICAALRLARFNVQTEEDDTPKTHFIGLPTTMAAVVMAGYVLFAADQYTAYGPVPLAALLVLVLSPLMISNVTYEKRNVFSPRFILKDNRVISGSIILATVVLYPQIAVFAWGIGYIAYGLIRSILYTFILPD